MRTKRRDLTELRDRIANLEAQLRKNGKNPWDSAEETSFAKELENITMSAIQDEQGRNELLARLAELLAHDSQVWKSSKINAGMKGLLVSLSERSKKHEAADSAMLSRPPPLRLFE